LPSPEAHRGGRGGAVSNGMKERVPRGKKVGVAWSCRLDLRGKRAGKTGEWALEERREKEAGALARWPDRGTRFLLKTGTSDAATVKKKKAPGIPKRA